jgi:glucose-1-phosphate thymidylyltransferase
MKGILLAGGSGTRLWPSTTGTSKQLIPIFDKPLIYYPLSTLMLAGIRQILMITTEGDQRNFMNLLGDGSRFGVELHYAIQNQPDGIASAIEIGANFVENDKFCLILGDNIFHGAGMGLSLEEYSDIDGALVFGYKVHDPTRYGIVEIDIDGNIVSIEEKPRSPKSNIAIPGIYFFDETAIEKSQNMNKSSRGEFEITSVLQKYLDLGTLRIRILNRGTAWLDCGTATSLNDASNYVRVVEERQGFKIACLEEIAFRQNWITQNELKILAEINKNSEYGGYLKRIADDIN